MVVLTSLAGSREGAISLDLNHIGEMLVEGRPLAGKKDDGGAGFLDDGRADHTMPRHELLSVVNIRLDIVLGRGRIDRPGALAMQS